MDVIMQQNQAMVMQFNQWNLEPSYHSERGTTLCREAEGDKVEARSGAVWGDGKNMEPPLKRDLR